MDLVSRTTRTSNAHPPAKPPSLRQLRRRAEEALAGVPLPRPFALAALCRTVETQRHRPLLIEPLPPAFGLNGPCGLWAATDSRDYLFYDPAAAPWHQEYVVLHEIGHLLGGHDLEGESSAELFAQALPDLSGETIRHVYARSAYNSPQEQEAEMIAQLILERVGEARSDVGGSAPSPEVRGVLARLSAALGGEQR